MSHSLATSHGDTHMNAEYLASSLISIFQQSALMTHQLVVVAGFLGLFTFTNVSLVE
jgi:hypothetical protein